MATPYATQADLVPLRMSQKDLIELTVDSAAGAPNANAAATTAEIVSLAIAEASGVVESYCRNRYVTPLQPSADVTSWTLDITVYLLFSRRRQTKINETVQSRYDRVISFLKDVAAGRASIDQPASQQTPQSSLAGPQISERDRHLKFSERNLKGFV